MAAAGVDTLIVVGKAMLPLASALAGTLDVRLVADAAAARAELAGLLAAGDVLLVKGSNSVGLGGLVAALSAREDRA